MINPPIREDLQRVVVLNPKGGCGKTTIATNLASRIARRGPMPALLDADPQGASMRWLQKRPRNAYPVHGIAACKAPTSVTRTWQLRAPAETRHLIIDTPAGLDAPQMHELLYDASNVIVPVFPSPIDIRFAARFIAELLLVAQIDRGSVRVGIVANRTRRRTRSLERLMRFLNSLGIPVITVLRDSQNFVEAAGRGIGVHDLPPSRAARDAADIDRVVHWIEQSARPARTGEVPAAPITARRRELPGLP